MQHSTPLSSTLTNTLLPIINPLTIDSGGDNDDTFSLFTQTMQHDIPLHPNSTNSPTIGDTSLNNNNNNDTHLLSSQPMYCEISPSIYCTDARSSGNPSLANNTNDNDNIPALFDRVPQVRNALPHHNTITLPPNIINPIPLDDYIDDDDDELPALFEQYQWDPSSETDANMPTPICKKTTYIPQTNTTKRRILTPPHDSHTQIPSDCSTNSNTLQQLNIVSYYMLMTQQRQQ